MKKAIMFLSALMLTLALCACAQKDTTDPTESPTHTPTEATTQASTEGSSAAPTEESTEAATTKATKAPTKATQAPPKLPLATIATVMLLALLPRPALSAAQPPEK